MSSFLSSSFDLVLISLSLCQINFYFSLLTRKSSSSRIHNTSHLLLKPNPRPMTMRRNKKSIYLPIELSGSSAESEELRWIELNLTWFMIRAYREIFHCSFQISIYSMVFSNSISLYFINSLLCAKRDCNNRFDGSK
ncbi:unnamed protein product, partial [Brassica oleracea]